MARKDSDQSKLWGGRFDEPTDPTVERFTTSVHFDRALAHYDIRGSLAHVAMLAHAEIIPEGDARLIEEGLEKIAAEIEAGTFQFDPALEDIHMNIEARLGELAGPAAGRLHTGRSRNDQVATDLALYLRDATLAARHGLLQMRLVLLERAYEHIDTLLPGYTHLQRAQPVRLAHHWLAFATMLGRDAGRFKDASERLTASPLGSGALAGSTLSLDREHTAKSLGFAELRVPTASTRWLRETGPSSGFRPPLLRSFISRAWRRSWSCGRPPSSASSNSRTPTRRVLA